MDLPTLHLIDQGFATESRLDARRCTLDELARAGPAWDAASVAAQRFMSEEFDVDRIVDRYVEALGVTPVSGRGA